MEYVVGVDIGTQSTKALLCDRHGRIVAQHAKAYHPDTPQPLWAEQDAAVWLDAVIEAIARTVEKARTAEKGFAAGDVRSVCISGLYGGSGIPVDAAMRPLHPCVIWMDRRAEAQVRWVKANVDRERLLAITGNHVDSYYGYTKIMWIRDNRPEIFAKTRYFLPPNAWVIHALTGELAIDHSSAGNIGGIYDLARRDWSNEMMTTLGIPRAMMPDRLVGSTDIVGRLLPVMAARLSLEAGTPVVAGGVDAAVATFAAGATRKGQHVAMIGTSMCWGFITPQVDTRNGHIAMPHVFHGERDVYVFGGANTAGESLTWFVEKFGATRAGREAFQELDAAAGGIAPGSEGLVFLPYLMGERSPIWDGEASGAFVGLTLAHARAHAYRAVLEGVTYALRHNIEGADTRSLDRELIVVGGAAKSDLWLQIIADVTARPVLTIAEDVEAAMGAALLAAIGVGLVDDGQAAKGWVTLRPHCRPREAAGRIYDGMFDVYKGLYPALKDGMHKLHAVARTARQTP